MNNNTTGMIKAVIFDLDGLIIDSEPLWKKAEIEIFARSGIILTPELCGVTEGLRIDEVVTYWDEKWPGKIENKLETERAVIKKVGQLISDEGEALPGVIDTISLLTELNIPLAIASASGYYLIDIVVNKLKLNKFFQVIQSAEKLEYGKPHPQVFIEAAKKLNVAPYECLVFEDSVFGVLAAKAARMKAIAVPYKHNFNKKEFHIADKKIASLSLFNNELFSELNQ